MTVPRFRATAWRLIVEPLHRSGPLNMAVDEALLRGVAASTAPPTLRLYGWSPPALTLGRGQSADSADLGALAADGISLVRRATGGTAVLDRDVFSYSVAVPTEEPRLGGGIADSYQGVSLALLWALDALGVEGAEASSGSGAGGQRPRERSEVCFELPSDYEITLGVRKLFGSAQMRIRGGILQHGAMTLGGDMGDISRYLVGRPDPLRIRARTVTLEDALGHRDNWERVADAVAAGFAAALNLELYEGELSPEERMRAEALLAGRYACDAWTRRL